jgi:drug/metabolite transporter (DMT)-like permease
VKAIAARAAALPAETRGALLLIAATFCFSTMDAVGKSLMARHDPFQVVWARYVSQAVLVVLVVAPRLRSVARTRYLGLQLVRSALMFGATLAGFLGFSMMPLAEATAVFEIAPLCITALAALLLGEKVGPRRWTGVAVGFLGAMLIVRPGLAAFQPAALLPMTGAFCFAAYTIATRFLGRDESAWTTFLYSAALGALAASLFVPLVWTTPTAVDAGLMLAMGAIGGAGQLLVILAFTAARASAIAPFSYTGLIWAMAWGMALFNETPDAWTVAGAAAIVGSGLYVWTRERARAAA